ncbi:MAG TPA: AMP-binding protein [Burkholderiaceae bacterium]|nr:AMP-binding protein [Burkholderiaceae bacterium]
MATLTYIDLLDRAARCVGDQPALTDDQVSLSHAELGRLTHRIARALIRDGFAPSTPFAVLSPNTSLALTALLGGLRAGGAWSNINLRSGVALNADILNRGGCRWLFFHSSVAAQIPELAKGAPGLTRFVCLDRDDSGHPSLQAFIEGASDAPVNIRLAPDAVGFQGSTGGTTGAPKITQGSTDFLTWNAIGFMNALSEFDAEHLPVNLAVAPITHAGGIVAMATLAMGGQVVLMPTPDLGLLLKNVAKHRVSLLFLPPTVIYMLMGHPDCAGTDFSSLRYLMAAAAPFATEKIAKAHQIFGPVICQSFGQTESGFPITFMSKAAVTAALNDAALAPRLKSVGRPTSNVSAVEVMDDEGNLLGPDQVGEIVLQGPTTMLRYIGDPAATAAVQAGGWQHTGDLGFRDKDGFIYLNDRKRDLIISGGFNVFPLQVEQVLNRHPAVQDCAVIGVPDEKWGEAVKAVVELVPGKSVTADELMAMCKAELGSVMAPKSVDFTDALPRSPVGKVLKRTLREPYWTQRQERI